MITPEKHTGIIEKKVPGKIKTSWKKRIFACPLFFQIIALDSKPVLIYIKEGGKKMGSININVPGDIELEYKIENTEAIEKILRIIKGVSKKEKVKKPQGNDEIVGIWKDRFPEELSSEIIQKNLRMETWRRF